MEGDIINLGECCDERRHPHPAVSIYSVKPAAATPQPRSREGRKTRSRLRPSPRVGTQGRRDQPRERGTRSTERKRSNSAANFASPGMQPLVVAAKRDARRDPPEHYRNATRRK
ncbi:hypothetical protein KCP73_22615 [Salmonella enterica subsp. enterica]|nr:hypothetical protein KCP73_22615 [Salmonella enterica subsp. enterica]